MQRLGTTRTRSGLRPALLPTAAGLLAASVTPAAHAAGTGRTSVVIQVLSSRADLVASGEALVRVTLPQGSPITRLRVTVGRRDETSHFARQSATEADGLVTGLALGRNVVTAVLPNGSGARITLTNHPNGGPLFAGPQIQPWACQAGARDKRCDQPATYTYYYESTNPAKTGLQPYDTKNPPSDVATTTTQTGVTVPFIVRLETGYQDRDQYQIAALDQPGKPWTAVRPQAQFARKLLITHGGGCGNSYTEGPTPSVLSYQQQPDNPDSAVWALGKGWAVMSTTLDNNGVNCDVALAAESLLMAKERVIDRYGPLTFTVGVGCSGGSLTQQWVANAYPGIYQGVLLACSFPDTWTAGTQVFDYHLLNHYFESPSAWSAGVAWTPTQMAAVEGSSDPVNSATSDELFYGQGLDPSYACPGTTTSNRYSSTNPGGVRCSSNDFAINVFGPRAKQRWGGQERQLRRGFAGLPLDNTGVQYGLAALKAGQITPAQFVDLNTKIGGLNPENLSPVASRNVTDPFALKAAYRSGMINEANNYNQTAIIDCRGTNPDLAHDTFRSFALRARLDRDFGNHANQLIWEGPGPLDADRNCQQDSLVSMDQWLTAIHRDHRDLSVSQKIKRDKPAGLTDRCYDGVGNVLADALCPSALVPIEATPRTVAGDAITTDTNECRLQPLKRSSYGVTITVEQWTALDRAYPNGVCDFSKPGVDQHGTVPWMTYATTTGAVIYGGHPLGSAPSSTPFTGPRPPTSARGNRAVPVTAALAETGSSRGVAGGALMLLFLAALTARAARRRS